jgi:hypothetical protein
MVSDGDTNENLVPFTFGIDKERREKLRAASRSTRIPMSEIVRMSIDYVMELLGDPENPSGEGLQKLLSLRTGDK